MKKTFPLYFILPVLVPMLLGMVLYHLSSGPTMDELRADLKDPDPERREAALVWMTDTMLPSTVKDIKPLLLDKDEDVRKRAYRAIGKLRNPNAIEPLYEAYLAHPEQWKDIFSAMKATTQPQALPYFQHIAGTAEGDVSERAARYRKDLHGTLNLEISFYSLGSPIYNELGHVIYSQAVLFPEGQQRVAEGNPLKEEVDERFRR